MYHYGIASAMGYALSMFSETLRDRKLVTLRTPVNNIEYFPPNFEGLVLGCIDADFCK